MQSTAAGTRHFASISEIADEPGFSAEAPIDADSYQELVGWYAFHDQKLRCCVLKPSAALCLTHHGKGWVARRKDGTATLIGGDCARSKFAAGSIAVDDMRRAQSEIVRINAEVRLQELLLLKDERIAEITNTLSQLDSLRTRLQKFATEVGPAVWKALCRQATEGTTRIVIQGHTPATRDHNGNIIKQRKSASIVVGSLPGVRVCDQGLLQREVGRLTELKRSYLADLPNEGRKRAKALREITAILSSHSQQIQEAQRLLTDGESFGRCDLSPVIFLTSDQSTRIKLAQLVHQQMGIRIGRNSAKEWLQLRDRTILASGGVSKLDL